MSLITRGAPALILPSRWRDAPLGPIEPNPSCRWAGGIVLGSAGGSPLGPSVGTGSLRQRRASAGAAEMLHAAQGDYLLRSVSPIDLPITVLWRGVVDGAIANNTLRGLVYTSGAANRHGIHAGRLGTGFLQLAAFSQATGTDFVVTAPASNAFALGTEFSVVGVFAGASSRALYVNGVLVSSSNANVGASTLDRAVIGGLYDAGALSASLGLVGRTRAAFVTRAALTADEVADWHADPFIAVRRRSNRLISIARAATAQTPGVAVSGVVIESQGDASGALAVGSVIAAGVIVEDQGSASGAAVVEIRSGGDFLEPLPPFEDSSGESYAGGKLKIMAPIPILGIGEPGTESAPAYLVSSNAREETEPVYSTETIYGIGDVVVFGSAVYQSLANANAGNNPAQRPTKWARVRPTYSAGAFDLSLSTVSVAAGELDMLITTNGRPDTLCLHAVVGDQAQVDVIRGATTIYREVRDLWREELAGSSERLPDNRAFFNLLCEPGDQVRVTVRRGGLADASVRAVTLGNAEVLGNLVSKPSVGTINRDKVSFDSFGELQVQAAGFQETVDGEIEVDSGRVDRVVALSRRYRSTPVVVIGVDNLFRCLLVYGVLREIKADPTQDPITSVRFGVTGLAAT